jgi:hypothetical protein
MAALSGLFAKDVELDPCCDCWPEDFIDGADFSDAEFCFYTDAMEGEGKVTQCLWPVLFWRGKQVVCLKERSLFSPARILSGDAWLFLQLHHSCVVDLTKRCARALSERL